MATAASERVRAAVVRPGGGWQALLDKAFARAFTGLVYAQIWEDPVADLRALALGPTDRVVTIASGGCNALSYLLAGPASVAAVDLNAAHIAFNRLKAAAVRHLPTYEDFHRFYAQADDPANIRAYDALLRPHLDPATRAYWDGRDARGRRRVEGFARGVYRTGLLGRFIALAHLLARLYRIDLTAVARAPNLAAQRALFEREIAPVFDRPLVRRLLASPASLFGLGIPPAQYAALAGDDPGGIRAVLRARAERLACGWPVADNYFAQQAFGRRYATGPGASLPPYLARDGWEALRARIDRLDIVHANVAEHLGTLPAGTVDAVVLLDAQDWMTDAQLTQLWSEVTRTAAPGARVLFRTAGTHSILPGRLPPALLGRWAYDAEASAQAWADDRSAIYGGVHLYRLAEGGA